MLIRRTGLILKQMSFWILLLVARLERFIIIKTKEYERGLLVYCLISRKTWFKSIHFSDPDGDWGQFG